MLLLMTAMTTCHKGLGNTEVENTFLSLNQQQPAVCEQVLLILCYLKLLYTAYNMTLVHSPVEGIKTSLIFFRGLVHLAAPWALGIFLPCLYCVVAGAASRVYDFYLYWELGGRGKKISATLYNHAEKVLR